MFIFQRRIFNYNLDCEVSTMTGVNSGFDISYDDSINIVTLRLSGFWDMELGEKFEREFQEKVREVHANGKEWHLLLNLTRCPPQLQEVQNIVSRAMIFAKEAGMQKKAILVDGSIAPFQVDKLIQDPELQINFYFRSEDDAIRWLLGDMSPKRSEKLKKKVFRC